MNMPLLKILRTSKVFAVVLGLHLFVLSLLLFHPGCQHARSGATPSSEVTSLENATFAEPTRPSDGSYTSSADMTPINDTMVAGGADMDSSYTSSSVTSNEMPPAPVGNTTYTVQKGDSLWGISRKNGVTVAALAEVNNISRNATLKVGQVLTIPAATMPVSSSSSTSYTAPSSVSTSGIDTSNFTGTYKVVSGDTLGKIAKRTGTTVRALQAANNLSGSTIRIGQKLKIPAGTSAAAPVSSTASYGNETSLMSQSSVASSATMSADGTMVHKVAAGESPAVIAKKYGMKTADLMALNNITDPRKLRIGQELKISSATTATVSSDMAPVSATESVPSVDGTTTAPSVEALEAATGTSTDVSAPIIEVTPEVTQ